MRPHSFSLAVLVVLSLGTRPSVMVDGIIPQHVPHGVVGNVVSSAGILAADPPPADSAFIFHDLGHRCIDAGARDTWQVGGPVFTSTCNNSDGQRIHVRELDTTHDIALQVRASLCIGLQGGRVAAGSLLELQTCNDSPAQRFALDGDSILMGAQLRGQVTREYAIEPQEKRTPERTPLVVVERTLSDAEYFRFEAADHSSTMPTNGFFTVSNEAALDWALTLGWGTVIAVDDRVPLVLTKTPKLLHAGVTLRGYRKYTYQGPEIRTCQAPAGGQAFQLSEATARITGLRLRGQTQDPNCTGELGGDSSAIQALTGTFVDTGRIWIDHLDIGYWHGHAIDVRGSTSLTTAECPDQIPGYPRNESVRAVGNFIHHNANYGIVTGQGAFIFSQGNVVYLQGAHSFASDPVNTSGYNAHDNFILSNERDTHDIDMHGSENPGHWQGGHTGDYYDVGWNTILHKGHMNIDIRGTPCRFIAIHDNIFIQSKSDAIQSASTSPYVSWANKFNVSPNPMSDLAAGDFDGDGIDDVFVGTGAAWYFSSGGRAEWRLLNRMPEHASELRFGDFDGDGRTDVIALHGALIDVSWGGQSPWQTINVTAWPIAEIAVGDFDGDHYSDLFLSTGTQWFYAPKGRNWTPYGISHYHTKDLRFADFTKAGRTEVLRVDGSHHWSIVTNVGAAWQQFADARVGSVAGLVAGDFDGDGFADLARLAGNRREITSPALGPGWVFHGNATNSIDGLPLGHFDSDMKLDVAFMSNRHFYYLPGAKGAQGTILSRQDME